jgi:hypothetical protein
VRGAERGGWLVLVLVLVLALVLRALHVGAGRGEVEEGHMNSMSTQWYRSWGCPYSHDMATSDLNPACAYAAAVAPLLRYAQHAQHPC